MFGPSAYLLKPLTENAKTWIEENLSRFDRNVTWFGGGVAIEHGYINDVMMGIKGDGLTDEFELTGQNRHKIRVPNMEITMKKQHGGYEYIVEAHYGDILELFSGDSQIVCGPLDYPQRICAVGWEIKLRTTNKRAAHDFLGRLNNRPSYRIRRKPLA